MPDQRVLVVGASLGGLRAAEAVRAAGFSGELMVIGAEHHMPYNRPPLSKEALAGSSALDAAALAFRRRKSVDDVRWLLGRAAVGADLVGRRVKLDDGSELAYDGLVVATGLRPRRLALPGPAAGRHALRTIEDAVALRDELGPDRRVVVIGAGFIGCEVAATARGLGCRVDVVAPEEVPMQRALGLVVGAALQRRHTGHGVTWHLGRVPVAFEGERWVSSVVLDDGRRLPADVVVEALGCLPNTEWLSGSTLELSDGVLTDGWLRALDTGGRPVPEVVAVGDLARFPNALFDDVPRRVEHWSMPTDTAKRAGPTLVAHLAGLPPEGEPFAVVPSFWSDQYDVRLQSFGAPGIGETVELLDGEPDGDFVAGYLRGGDLVGVAGVGLMPKMIEYRARISRPG